MQNCSPIEQFSCIDSRESEIRHCVCRKTQNVSAAICREIGNLARKRNKRRLLPTHRSRGGLFLYMYITGKEYDLLVAGRNSGHGRTAAGKTSSPGVRSAARRGNSGSISARRRCARNLLWRTASRADARPRLWASCSKASAGWICCRRKRWLSTNRFPMCCSRWRMQRKRSMTSWASYPFLNTGGVPLPILICKAGDLPTTITTAFRWAPPAG